MVTFPGEGMLRWLALLVLAVLAACQAVNNTPGPHPEEPDRLDVPALQDGAPVSEPLEPTPSPTAAASPPPVATPAELPVTTSQFRAFWVDAFHPGFKSRREVDQLIRDMQSANANSVIVQVRRRGEVYYSSTLEPRSEDPELEPGFDALAYLIERAHAARPPIEVHAWLATFPIWPVAKSPPSDPRHVYNLHGAGAQGDANWLSWSYDGRQHDGENYSLDPGHPGALRHTVEVYLEVVRNYDVDGIHFDYVRYMDREYGYNPVNVARFNARFGRTGKPDPGDLAWSQWRRDQVTAFVRQTYLRAIAIKPHIKVSAALIAWGSGPVREEEWERSSPMVRTFQDWRAWLEEGVLDLAIPMVYFRYQDPKARVWFDQWTTWAKDHAYRRQVALGISAFMNDVQDTLAQVKRALSPSPNAKPLVGVSFFSYASPDPSTARAWTTITGTSGDWTPLDGRLIRALSSPPGEGQKAVFSEKARVPDMPWKERPDLGHVMGWIEGPDGRPADGATVRLSGPQEASTVTDGTGFYGFVDLPPGSYRLTAVYQGRELSTAATVEVRPGQVTQVK